MKPVRCAILPASLSLLAGVVGIGAETRAQSQSAPADGTKIANQSGPKKPVHKLNEVASTDSVVLLGARRGTVGSEESATLEKAPSEAAGPAASAEKGVTAEDTEKKAAEIASLEKQIQDKMKRITLLMRLFVNDEKPFIADPADATAGEATQQRRKYEQDELLWETAELAKLKMRLNAITAAK